MNKTKTCAAIHDLSGLGKCSLTVALPILSAAGIETSVMPTALFSNHTAFPSFFKHDLTEDMLPIAEEWKKIGASFDAIYSGFLGSLQQINIVSEIFDIFGSKDNLILVDPVMGDNGKLYRTYSDDMADGMVKLCRKADIIVPNMTEACRILKINYVPGPYHEKYIREILLGLLDLGVDTAVLTGVFFDDAQLGSACMTAQSEEITFAMAKKYPGMFHGTGDVFASAFLAKLMGGFGAGDAAAFATDFTARAIKNTVDAGSDPLMGVKFENELKTLR